MPGPILHERAQVQCAHGGRAAPTVPFPRVLVNGMAVAVQPVPWAITGCPLPPPTNGNGPCLTATFTTAATRVFVNLTVLLMDSASLAAPTGTPLTPLVVQPRVVAM